jgi:transposase
MLGIDTSKDQLVCARLDRPAGKFRWEKTFPNTPEGVPQLLPLTPPESPWILEPTGRYRLSVAKQARQAGRTVLLAPPRKAKAYLQSMTSRAKTDRLDGRGLAMFAASRPAREALGPYPIKPEAVEDLDQLLAARRRLVDALTALRQRLGERPYAADTLRQAVADLEGRKQEWDQPIAPLTADPAAFPTAARELARLRQVPGIGPVTAAAPVSRLLGRSLAHGEQFVAYVGLDVGSLRSGKRQGERRLTKQGDAELRRLF